MSPDFKIKILKKNVHFWDTISMFALITHFKIIQYKFERCHEIAEMLKMWKDTSYAEFEPYLAKLQDKRFGHFVLASLCCVGHWCSTHSILARNNTLMYFALYLTQLKSYLCKYHLDRQLWIWELCRWLLLSDLDMYQLTLSSNSGKNGAFLRHYLNVCLNNSLQNNPIQIGWMPWDSWDDEDVKPYLIHWIRTIFGQVTGQNIWSFCACLSVLYGTLM